MNDKLTISTFKLFKLFPDQDSARAYLERRRWPNGPTCPECQETARIATRKGGFYRCNACKLDFTVRTGTIFERSHIPLHKWVYAMYLLVTARKGISSLQLSKEIGVTQKTAWFMLHRLREACGADLPTLRGTVEVDETYLGGKEANKHQKKKLRQGRGAVGKSVVLGMRERSGRTLAQPIDDLQQANLHQVVFARVEPGTQLYSDDHRSYDGLAGLFYRHETIKHSAGEYVRGSVSTNSIESVWAVLKRGVDGVYHHVSPKHLGRYVNEFIFRLNQGNVQRHTLKRLDSLIERVIGKRLTYAQVTAS